MQILFLILVGWGLVFTIIGLCFTSSSDPSKKYPGKTTGTITGLTIDAMKYNEEHSDHNIGVYKELGEIGDKKVILRAGVGGQRKYQRPNAVTYHPIYNYTVDGVEYSVADSLGYSHCLVKDKVGTNIDIYYKPENPYKIKLPKSDIVKTLGKLFLPCGVIALAAGIVLFIIFSIIM